MITRAQRDPENARTIGGAGTSKSTLADGLFTLDKEGLSPYELDFLNDFLAYWPDYKWSRKRRKTAMEIIEKYLS